MSIDYEIFPGKNLGELFKDIYTNQVNKKVKISAYIDEIRGKVRHFGDYGILGDIIKDLLESSVKNDEHLIKLAQIVQRLIASDKEGDDDGILTEAEKKQLLDALDDVKHGVTDYTIPTTSSINSGSVV